MLISLNSGIILICIILLLTKDANFPMFIQCINKKRSSFVDKKDIINDFIKQTARWAVAAEQDVNPLIAVLHADYGVAYAMMLRNIATDEEILKATNMTSKQFMKKITDIQVKATRKATKVCPQYAMGLDQELARIGGDTFQP